MTRASIATVCISGSLDEKISAIARAKFDGIELFEPDLIASRLSPEDVRRRLDDQGLTLDLYQPLRDIESTRPEDFARALERSRRKFAVMERLGADTVLVCSNVASAVDDAPELAISQLSRLAEVAADHGVRIAYEALAWGSIVSTYQQAWEIVEAADHPALGICLDSFHILSRRSRLDTIATIPGDKIFYLQLADAPRSSLDVLSWSRHHRLFPGEGDWDLADLTSRVLAVGYRGPLSLEVFNDVFRQSSPTVTARDARRSLVLLEERLGLARPDARPGLPAAPEVTGFSYVELEPGQGTGLTDVLKGLGFSYRGSHRRKDVQLWEQGAARIIVNDNLLGRETGIASVGLATNPQADVTGRADALLIARVPRDEQVDIELRLDGFAAPDGTVVVADPSADEWRAEFGEGAEELAGLGILEIDHLALGMPWQRTPEAVLFFRGLFGLGGGDPIDVASEVGLVSSRALRSASDHPARIVLNVPPVADDSSGFVNHVAFAIEDLRTAVRELGARKVPLLEIPDNYYDDLQARLGLDDDEVEEFRNLGILVDQEGGRRFLHAYLRPNGRFQVELVERTSGYEGFGAVNAPVRLAALRADPARRATTP